MARDNIEDEEEEREVRRPAGPRFGPFVTIAVAILLLFGAASRIGKTPTEGGWLNVDFLASKSLEREQLRQQEQRNTTLITLGAIPSAQGEVELPTRGLQLRENVLPPQRDVDYYTYQEELERQRMTQVPLSMQMPLEGNQHFDGSGTASRFDPAPEATPHERNATESLRTYVVSQGDNWVKIGKHVGKRWQDVQRANPQAQNGLRVGMKLTIPQ